MRNVVIFEGTVRDHRTRIRQIEANECLVEIWTEGAWEAVDDDAFAAEIYTVALLAARSRGRSTSLDEALNSGNGSYKP